LSESVKLKGIAASPGVAIGRSFVLDRARVHIFRTLLAPSEIREEKQRFLDAVEESKAQLLDIRNKIDAVNHREHALIIDTHIAILDDELFTDATLNRIEKERVNAEYALRQVLDETKQVFADIDDSYLKERFNDIDYVGERTLRNLVGKREHLINEIKAPSVIVAQDLSPADTAQMNKEKVLGFATIRGGPTSHTAIVARSLEIPAVVGVEGLFDDLNDGDEIIIDGIGGTVVIRPDAITREYYVRVREEYEEIDRELHREVELPAATRDEQRVVVSANLEIIDELPLLKKHGAEGVGLYRTEYLYLDRTDLPTEEEHYENYRRVIENVAPNPTTIRTLDLGGDKFNHALPMPPEMNPAMGLRAIRFCLRETDIFRTQLRAILRASVHGPVRIMFPMISGLMEIREALKHCEEVKEELRKEGIDFDEKVQVGCMVEVPAAAVIAPRLSREVDFFSIGTNDLIQYTLAIDRVNEHVSYLYEPLHPAVISLIKQVSDAGRAAEIDVAMCGEMAGKPLYIPLLLGLGITSLSMPAQAIPRAKRVIRALTMKEVREMAGEVFKFDTAAEINAYLKRAIRERWADAFPKNIFQEDIRSPAAERQNVP